MPSVFTVVSATFVCRVALYASGRAVTGYGCLNGARFTKREYQHLSYVVNVMVPVRYLFDKL
jgi:CxxC motif-containing protein